MCAHGTYNINKGGVRMGKIKYGILKQLRLSKNKTQAQVAAEIGIGRTGYTKIENGTQDADTEIISKLADYFGVTVDYLLGRNELNYLGNVIENKKIPIIGSVKCGPNGLAFEYLEGYVVVDDTLTGNIVAFRCKGDSMKDIGIIDDDIAIVRQQDDVECGELAVVIVNGDEGTLKRIRKFDGGIILEAANPDYPPRIFTGEDLNKIKIVGKVLETRRKR